MSSMNDLTGTPVMIHPDLADDPVNKQGQIGLVTFANFSTDDIYVSFGKEQALYASDALLVFRNPNDIYRDLLTNAKSLATTDIKDLYRIGMLLDSGQSKDQKTAMELILANPTIRNYALMTLEDKLGPLLNAAEEQKPNLSASRGR